MAWFDEEIAMEAATESAGMGDINANLGDDLAEALGIAGIDTGQDWVSASVQAYKDYRNMAESQRMYDPPKTEGSKAPDAKEGQGLIGKLSNWVDKNRGLSEILLKGVAGAAAGNQAKRSAEVAAQSRLDELKLKNQQEREKDAMVSASVSGLRQPGGLMARGQLKRTDGSVVYQNGRIV